MTVRKRRIKPVLQATATDCSLACLSMVLQAFGSNVGREALRGYVEASYHGISVSALMDVARRFGLAPEARRVELDDLAELDLPAILHWNFNHFVVLERVDAGGARVIDPKSGRRTLSTSELSDHFTGIAITFKPSSTYRRQRKVLDIYVSDLWQSVHGLGAAVFAVVSLSVLIQVVVLVPPIVSSIMIDEGIGIGQLKFLLVLFSAYLSSVILSTAGEFLRREMLLKLGTQLSGHTSTNLVKHMLDLPFTFYLQRRLNDLLTRIESTRALKDVLTEGAVPIVVDGTFSAIALIALLWIYPPVGLVAVAGLGAIVVIKVMLFPTLRELADKSVEAMSEERGSLMDSLRAIQTVKVMSAEAVRLRAWRGANQLSLRATRHHQRFVALHAGLGRLATGTELASITLICAKSVIAGDLTVGVMFAVIALRQQIQDRAYPLVDKVLEFRLLRSRFERLADITRSASEYGAVGLERGVPPGFPGRIAARKVSFRFPGESGDLFRDLDLTIEERSFVAIKGRSGGGKSTLMRLFLGLLRPTGGTVEIGDSELDAGNVRAYRQLVGAVLQDDQLFSGTILDNICMFAPEPDFARVAEVARCADIHDDIMSMPMGYFSLIGDMGSALSGGQRQRVLLARALFRQPRLLVLDEGTANLDPASEIRILRNIKALGISILGVAHRAQMLEEADLVYELKDGQLILQRGVSSVAGQRQPSQEAA